MRATWTTTTWMNRMWRAAACLALTGACNSDGERELPTSPTPTTPTRQLERISWECDRAEATVGTDLHCQATGHYNQSPVDASLTSELTANAVETSDAAVLEPDRYRPDLDGQPFTVRTLSRGNAETWVLFDGTTSNRWAVDVQAAAPVRTLLNVDWECDRREATEGDDILCHATAAYNTDPQQVDITSQMTRSTVRTSDAEVLQPERYDAGLPTQPFIVAARGAGNAATWVVFEEHSSERWNVTVRSTTTENRWRGIRVAPEAGRTGYERPNWNVRDTEIHQQDGSPACTPYTRTPITDVGPGDGLDREHIVALAEAWDSRPTRFDRSTLRRIAEDHANLTLALARANRSKGARDAAEWQPEYNGAWMAHRVIEVKRKYDLSVDRSERDWLERLLGSGPDRIICNGS